MNGARPGTRLEQVCVALLALVALGTLLGYVGAWSWLCDLFAHFRVQYCVLGVILAAVLGALRRPALAVISLLVLLANLPPIVPQFVRSAVAAPAAPGAPLKVVSFNVFKYSSQYQRMVDFVRGESPDVLVLIEVTPAWAPSLTELTRDFRYRWVNVGDDVSGLAVMSRRVPLETHVIDLGGNGVSSLQFTLPDPNGPVTFVATHLSWPLGPQHAAIRNAQLDSLARLARGHRGAFAIVGDLNVTPYSPRFQHLLRDGGLRSCAEGLGPQGTWPSLLLPLHIQIDHCLTNARVLASDFRVGGFLGSDHLPISVELHVQPLASGRAEASPPADMPPVSTRRIASSTPMSSGVSRSRGR
jgi:endonuclease/exonuclease/phosphatase (EEP) superfamily protein YafD